MDDKFHTMDEMEPIQVWHGAEPPPDNVGRINDVYIGEYGNLYKRDMGSWSALVGQVTQPVRESRVGIWAIDAGSSVAVEFDVPMPDALYSVSITPGSDPGTLAPYYTDRTADGFTVRIPESGTLSGTYTVTDHRFTRGTPTVDGPPVVIAHSPVYKSYGSLTDTNEMQGYTEWVATFINATGPNGDIITFHRPIIATTRGWVNVDGFVPEGLEGDVAPHVFDFNVPITPVEAEDTSGRILAETGLDTKPPEQILEWWSDGEGPYPTPTIRPIAIRYSTFCGRGNGLGWRFEAGPYARMACTIFTYLVVNYYPYIYTISIEYMPLNNCDNWNFPGWPCKWECELSRDDDMEYFQLYVHGMTMLYYLGSNPRDLYCF